MDAEKLSLQEDDEKELWRLSRFYFKEARRCENAGAYLAGCAMLGSALETLLLLMVSCHPEVAYATAKIPTRKGREKPVLEWNLFELLDVARAAGWLPAGLALHEDWSSRRAKIGDYAESTRIIRNWVHPARYARDHLKQKVTKRYLQRQFEIVLLCRDWLAVWNSRALWKALQEEDLWGESPC